MGLGSPEMSPDCSQSHFGTILRIFSFPPSVPWGAQKCSQTAARAILGRYYGFFPSPLGPLGRPEMFPDCSQNHFGTILRISFPPRSPGEARNVPRLQPKPFWDDT